MESSDALEDGSLLGDEVFLEDRPLLGSICGSGSVTLFCVKRGGGEGKLSPKLEQKRMHGR